MKISAERLSLIQDLGFQKSALPRLEEYVQLLWASNSELNLFSRQMPFEDLIDNHVIDCLLPLSRFPRGIQIAADFGSGGGLPGVLYALQFPQTKYLLFEKSPKKRQFLQKCQQLAPNLEIHGEIPNNLDGVEVITARAFKPLDVILSMSRQHYERGGKYFLLKGRREKIEEEIQLSKKAFKNLKVHVEALKSPLLEVERHLVQI